MSIRRREFYHHVLRDMLSSPHKSFYCNGAASLRAQAEVNLAMNQLIKFLCSIKPWAKFQGLQEPILPTELESLCRGHANCSYVE